VLLGGQTGRIAAAVMLAVTGLALTFMAPEGPWGNAAMVVGQLLLAAGATTFAPVLTQLRARRSAEQLKRTLSSSIDTRRTRIGDVEVPDLSIECLCDGHDDLEELVGFDLPRKLAEDRPPPPELPRLQESLLPVLEAEANERSAGLFDADAVDLVGYRPVSERPADGAPVMRLAFARTTYFTFALTSNSLDRDLTALIPDLGAPTLREHWAEHEPRSLRDVRDLPAPAKVGVGTVVRTMDGMLALLERGQVFQAPSIDRRALHCVAEGMIPTDRRDGYLSPRQTAFRGLREELAVGQDEVDRLRLTGLFFDHQRWHVVFTALAETRLTCEQLRQLAVSAGHHHETDSLHFFPDHPEDPDLVAFLLGDHATFGLASNHAAAAVLAALSATHGARLTAAGLRRPKR
jgi:hypothetical protein